MTLITAEYAREQRRLHETSDAYGSRGFNWGYLIAGIARIEKCESILDYGCGKGTLSETLKVAGFDVRKYDPGVLGCDALPQPADLVAAVDVLEHIEPECLSDVLDHVRMLTQKCLFVAIPTVKSKRTMSDGRNTHISIHEGNWWRSEFIRRGFEVRRVWDKEPNMWNALMQIAK